jgi:glycosyltransferase involved in cell wall biosynthesis
MREEMAAAFSAAGVSQNVEMPGRRNDVHAWMAQSRVFLLTSPSEGLSIALLEAMCAGAVPVVSDVGSWATWFERRDGFWCLADARRIRG